MPQTLYMCHRIDIKIELYIEFDIELDIEIGLEIHIEIELDIECDLDIDHDIELDIEMEFDIKVDYDIELDTECQFHHFEVPACRVLGMPIAMVVVRSLSSETSLCMRCFQLCHKPTDFLVIFFSFVFPQVRMICEGLTVLGAAIYIFLSLKEIYHQGYKIFFQTLVGKNDLITNILILLTLFSDMLMLIGAVYNS